MSRQFGVVSRVVGCYFLWGLTNTACSNTDSGSGADPSTSGSVTTSTAETTAQHSATSSDATNTVVTTSSASETTSAVTSAAASETTSTGASSSTSEDNTGTSSSSGASEETGETTQDGSTDQSFTSATTTSAEASSNVTESSATPCVNRVVSFGANGSGGDSDAAQSRIEIELGSDLPTGNTSRTIEFWAFIKSTEWVGEKNPIYYFGDPNVNAGQFGMDFGTNPVSGSPNNHATLDPFTGGGFSDDSTNDLGLTSATDQWVHIAMVWNGSVLKTYVNGEVKITTNGSGGVTQLATGSSVFSIGCNPTNHGCFSGMLDEFRVWKSARTDAEILMNFDKPVVGTETDLVGYWKFDEEPGQTEITDSVTSDGHTAHTGALKADAGGMAPTLVEPELASPVVCER